MQDHDWNDLKYLLALYRAGTLAGAARQLGVNETTVSRRMKRLENDLGTPLLQKNAVGLYDLTDAARLILDKAETVEQQNNLLRDRLGRAVGITSGTVRISAVPVIVQKVLVPGMSDFQQAYPDIHIELHSEPRNVDLTKRDADLAIRFSRPVQGGLRIKAKKLGQLGFGLYCAAHVPPDAAGQLDWIGYDDANATLPQARWIETMCRHSNGRLSTLSVDDLTTALEATLCGYGKTMLPNAICQNDTRLRLLAIPPDRSEMARDVWLLSHADQDNRAATVAVKSWLQNIQWQ